MFKTVSEVTLLSESAIKGRVETAQKTATYY